MSHSKIHIHTHHFIAMRLTTLSVILRPSKQHKSFLPFAFRQEMEMENNTKYNEYHIDNNNTTTIARHGNTNNT